MTIPRHKNIVLIDDDPITNFINSKIIAAYFDFTVTSFTSAEHALSELGRLGVADLDSLPDLIFLDINMPQMDGWEFLAEFQLLPVAVLEKSHVVMLSSSVDRDDTDRSKTFRCVTEFISKPLSKEKIWSLAMRLEDLEESKPHGY